MIEIVEYSEQVRDRLKKRTSENNHVFIKQVNEIINSVRVKKDAALFDYTFQFDGFSINKENIKVTQDEIDKAISKIPPNEVEIIKRAADRIRKFHERQKQNSWFDLNPNGEFLGQLVLPIENVGLYVPGGKAAYPSSVLMNAIPAQVAGVSNIIITTPVKADAVINPYTLTAAHILGISEIFKIGGAQAIAAMAFGTQSVPKVDKIVGPGNIYVALAKQAVFGEVNIDSIAGPSEITVIADSSANPRFVAADMLSQAEHDPLASAILITTDYEMAKAVKQELTVQTEALERKSIIESSLNDYGMIIIVKNLAEAANLSNLIAPEHLEICTNSPFDILPMIKHAGAVFLGNYSPEPLGDYMAGPNHVLPTSGTARFFSALSVDDFIKKTSVISFSKQALNNVGNDIVNFANAEGLTAHANAVRIRLDKNLTENNHENS